MNFGEALAKLKAGKKIARSKWEQSGIYIILHQSDKDSKFRWSFIFAATGAVALVPWTATHNDLLAEDWEEV